MKLPAEDAISGDIPVSMGAGRPWRNFILLMVPVVLFGAVYRDSLSALISLWNDLDRMTYSHGWLIAAICVWLLYRAGRQIHELNVAPDMQGAAALFLSSTAWLVASRTNIQTAQLVLFPVLCWSGIWALYGLAVAKRCLFACVYLLFAVPVWDLLGPVLQWGTIFAVRAMVRIAGIPAYFEANTIHLPAGAIVIEGGCSGLNFFVAGLSLVVLYGHLGNVVNRYKLCGLGVGLMVIDNWLRVFLILLAGHLTNMQHYLVRVEHVRFGYAMFAIIMAVFFFIGSRMRQDEDETAAKVVPQSGNGFQARRAVAVLASVVWVPAWMLVIGLRHPPELLSWPSAAPASDWAPVNAAPGRWTPVFENADAHSLLHWRNGEFVVDVFQAAYGEQHQGKKLAGFQNTVLGDLMAAKVLQSSRISEQFSEIELVDTQGQHHLVWHGYYVDDDWFHAPRRAQIWFGLLSLVSSPVSGVVALHGVCAATCDSTRALLTELVHELPVGPPPIRKGVASP